jgi:hypothetical protein
MAQPHPVRTPQIDWDDDWPEPPWSIDGKGDFGGAGQGDFSEEQAAMIYNLLLNCCVMLWLISRSQW